MWKMFRRGLLLSALLAALAFSSTASAVPVITETEYPLTLCLAYYDSRGQFISLEATANVTLNPRTGEAVIPIRNTPASAATIKVFLFDGEYHILAPVTVGNYSTGGQ